MSIFLFIFYKFNERLVDFVIKYCLFLFTNDMLHEPKNFLFLLVRWKLGTLGKRVGYVAICVWTLLRLDHRQQWHRRDDSEAWKCHWHRSIDITMGAGLMALLTRWWFWLWRLSRRMRWVWLWMWLGWIEIIFLVLEPHFVW